VISTSQRVHLFQRFHNSPFGGHCGVSKTYSRMRYIAYWPGMLRNVKRWVVGCLLCQRRKLQIKYIFSMVDHFACWVECVLLRNIKAKTCADAVFVHCVLLRNIKAKTCGFRSHDPSPGETEEEESSHRYQLRSHATNESSRKRLISPE